MTSLDDIRKQAEATIEGFKSMTPEDLATGAELVGEAMVEAVGKIASGIASVTPEDVQAGAELAADAVKDAVRKATE